MRFFLTMFSTSAYALCSEKQILWVIGKMCVWVQHMGTYVVSGIRHILALDSNLDYVAIKGEGFGLIEYIW